MPIIRLPSPPRDYNTQWANQYTRLLEQENQSLWNAIQALQMFVLPNYTTLQKLAIVNPLIGQMVFDTDLDAPSAFTSGGWVP